MTQSTHDLIAAKAARLRALMRLTEVAEPGSEQPPHDLNDLRHAPTWTGGGWAN